MFGFCALRFRSITFAWFADFVVLRLSGFGWWIWCGAGFACEVGLVVLICLLAFYVCGWVMFVVLWIRLSVIYWLVACVWGGFAV